MLCGGNSTWKKRTVYSVKKRDELSRLEHISNAFMHPHFLFKGEEKIKRQNHSYQTQTALVENRQKKKKRPVYSIHQRATKKEEKTDSSLFDQRTQN